MLTLCLDVLRVVDTSSMVTHILGIAELNKCHKSYILYCTPPKYFQISVAVCSIEP